MTIQTKRSSVLAMSGVGLLLAGLLAGCSAGDDGDAREAASAGGAAQATDAAVAADEAEAFCAARDGSEVPELDPTDAEGYAAVVAELTAQTDAMVPPSEIEDAWEISTDDLSGQYEFLRLRVSTEELTAEEEDLLRQYYAKFNTVERVQATADIDAFIEENCEA